MRKVSVTVVVTGGAMTADSWEESKHPRGNPKNAGQFAKGSGGGSKKLEAAKKEDKPKAEDPKARSAAPNSSEKPQAKAASSAKAKSEPAKPAEKSAGAQRARLTGKVEGKEQTGRILAIASKLFVQYANNTPKTEEARDALAMKFSWKLGVAKQVKDAAARAKTVVETNKLVSEGGFKIGENTYTPERRALHKKIVRELFFTSEKVLAAKPTNGDKPTMVILGGRGGSGKSWLTGKHGPVDASKFIVLDSDEIKKKLPEFKGWNAGQVHEESSDILDTAAKIAASRGLNVVFDQTLKSASSGPKRIEQFKSAGYQLEAHYMFCSPVEATMRALSRYASGLKKDGKGRLVFGNIIMSNVDNEKNFDALIPLVGRWSIWNNMGSAPTYVSGKGVRRK